MQKIETVWGKNGDWKARYSNLYSAKGGRTSVSQEQQPRRISFMSVDSTPYTSDLSRFRSKRRDSSLSPSEVEFPRRLVSLLSEQSDLYDSYRCSSQISDDLGGHETRLLDMVRARSKELENEAQDKTLDLAKDTIADNPSNEACIHGLSWRATDRSISRSRFSRVSTRRDMDIPSILAFNVNITKPASLQNPAFQKRNLSKPAEIPRWSFRRSVCPVCSQKWKDRSTIKNVKNSGLKRNSLIDLPTVSAPARLRTSITMAYTPRPTVAAADNEIGVGYSALRNTSATWQFTRARRLRIAKPRMPSPEAIAPPKAAAPCARKDLDLRVSRFLTDEFCAHV